MSPNNDQHQQDSESGELRTCVDLSVPGAEWLREEVSSSKQNISSWVWSAEKIT